MDDHDDVLTLFHGTCGSRARRFLSERAIAVGGAGLTWLADSWDVAARFGVWRSVQKKEHEAAVFGVSIWSDSIAEVRELHELRRGRNRWCASLSEEDAAQLTASEREGFVCREFIVNREIHSFEVDAWLEVPPGRHRGPFLLPEPVPTPELA